MITGIVVALPEEFSTLSSAKPKKGCCSFIADDILIVLSGAGPNNARKAAQMLLAEGAERLMSWGCAAALDEHLQPGKLTLPDRLITADLETIDIQSSWLDELQRLLSPLNPITNAGLAESKTLISTAEDKRLLSHKTGAVALDMESIAIAKAARAHRIDFAAVRAIADPAGMNLPKAVEHSLNPDGDVEINKLLSYLIRHPLELTGLIRLGLHFHASKKTLRQAATIWLPSSAN